MRNIKLQIEYDGTNYCGWQVQRKAPASPAGRQSGKSKASIQQTLEKALRTILQEKIKLFASGRTDAGVHALAQVANFYTKSAVSLEKLQGGLNGLLPRDIVISDVKEVPPGFNSRFWAKSKVYRYSILNRKFSSALLENKVYFLRYPLDIRLMQQASRCLKGRHDFKALCASASCAKDAIRTIKQISVRRLPDEFGKKSIIAIEVEANGFVYNMVRNIAGTLIEIGRGWLPRGSLKQILASRNRKLAGPTAPAQGLCLMRVKY